MPNCALVKNTVRIEDIIGQVVSLKCHGSWYQGRCPFHDDHHPSLVVWPATQTWKCMTCSDQRDDVIGFIARWRGCSIEDALRYLSIDEPEPASLSKPAVPASLPRASILDRHATYHALLTAWGLSARHARALRARGLGPADIQRAEFASLIPGVAPVPPTAPGIPGFAWRNDHWQILSRSGLAIPVRDVQGRIQALHVRVDDPGSGGKYRWVSSPNAPQGAASGAPVHVAQGVPDVVWITEGPLKAIVAQSRLGHTVLGIPGVNAWATVLDILPVLHPQRVVIALDHDAQPATAATVARHVTQLQTALTAAGWSVVTARWRSRKGLDDVLVAGVPVTLTPHR